MYFIWSFVCLYSLAYARAEISLPDFVQSYHQHLGQIQWDKMLSVNRSSPFPSVNIINIRNLIERAKDQNRLVSNKIQELCSFARTLGPDDDFNNYANTVSESKDHLLLALDHLEAAHQASQTSGVEVRMIIYTNGTVQLDVEPGYSCKVKSLLKSFRGNFTCNIRGTTFYSDERQTVGAEQQSFEHTYELNEAKNKIMSAVDQMEANHSPATAIDGRKLIAECNDFVHQLRN